MDGIVVASVWIIVLRKTLVGPGQALISSQRGFLISSRDPSTMPCILVTNPQVVKMPLGSQGNFDLESRGVCIQSEMVSEIKTMQLSEDCLA